MQIKNKVVLAALMMAFTLTPASAAKKPQKSSKASTSSSKKKTGVKKAAVVTAATAATVAAVASENSSDRSMNNLSGQFLTALWRLDPESAISVGKYDGAANLSIPDAASRQKQLAFIEEWLGKFGKLNASKMSDKQRTDLALLTNKLQSDRWNLTTLREFEWNPALYNVAGSIDFILNTEYAAQPQRLRTLLKRIASVPQYYAAARASIVNPTREHTQLAIAQSAGVLSVLDDLNKTAQGSILTATEKQLYNAHIAAARTAVQGYAAWLTEQDGALAQNGNARSFRIGKDLYEQKFAYDIQASVSAEQMYQKALAAREKLLEHMDSLSDELWLKTMGATAKPADRTAKIGMVIDKLSSRHVAAADFVPEIRRQIPQLQEWVSSHNLLTMDPKKPLVVRETPAYQRGVAGASIEAPGPYRPQDRTYYNVTPLDGETPEQAEAACASTTTGSCRSSIFTKPFPAITRSSCTPTSRPRWSSPSLAMAP